MIFKHYFIDLILAGKKTQTRRPNRGYYVVGKTYAIQPCRTCKGIERYRIMMADIWEEVSYERFSKVDFDMPENGKLMPVTLANANDEGHWSSFSFEHAFKELYPKWDGKKRWAFRFHVVEVNEE